MSLSQQMSALDRANEIRLARARLKAAIAKGEIFAASVLLDPPAEAEGWTVGQMLLAQDRWGVKRMQRFLTNADRTPNTEPVAEGKLLGALTLRQRMVLAGALNCSPGGRG